MSMVSSFPAPLLLNTVAAVLLVMKYRRYR